MAKGAIYYVKFLKNIQEDLPLSNGDLARLADLSENKVSAMRQRKAAKRSTQTSIRNALTDVCRRTRSTDLAEFLAGMEVKGKGALTLSDVFQTADWQMPDLRATGLDAAKLTPFLSDKQARQVSQGWFFTPFIMDRIRDAFAANSLPVPADAFRQGQDAEIVAIVDET